MPINSHVLFPYFALSSSRFLFANRLQMWCKMLIAFSPFACPPYIVSRLVTCTNVHVTRGVLWCGHTRVYPLVFPVRRQGVAPYKSRVYPQTSPSFTIILAFGAHHYSHFFSRQIKTNIPKSKHVHLSSRICAMVAMIGPLLQSTFHYMKYVDIS